MHSGTLKYYAFWEFMNYWVHLIDFHKYTKSLQFVVLYFSHTVHHSVGLSKVFRRPRKFLHGLVAEIPPT